MFIPLEEKCGGLDVRHDVYLSIQGQEYSNRFSAERTRDHTNVKILILSNKGKWLTNLKSMQHTKKLYNI